MDELLEEPVWSDLGNFSATVEAQLQELHRKLRRAVYDAQGAAADLHGMLERPMPMGVPPEESPQEPTRSALQRVNLATQEVLATRHMLDVILTAWRPRRDRRGEDRRRADLKRRLSEAAAAAGPPADGVGEVSGRRLGDQAVGGDAPWCRGTSPP